jgi:hypothetical protein
LENFRIESNLIILSPNEKSIGFSNDENSEVEFKNFSELLDQLNWESKDQYFELIEKLIDYKQLLRFQKKIRITSESSKRLRIEFY